MCLGIITTVQVPELEFESVGPIVMISFVCKETQFTCWDECYWDSKVGDGLSQLHVMHV